MKAPKAMEQQQDSESRAPYTDLDTRYGRIGISAVAAAVRCKSDTAEKRTSAEKNDARHYESD